MFEFIQVVLKEAWGKAFWAARWETFLGLLRDPSGFYAGVGKKEWDREAYLMGLSFSAVSILLSVLATTLFLGYFTPYMFIGFFIGLLWGTIEWFAGAFLLYYLVAWLFGFAAKLITKRDDTGKIRPILFTLAPTTLAVVIPVLGGILALAGAVILLVIAYEKVLKTSRGESVGASLLGYVFSGLAVWLPMIFLSGIFFSVSSTLSGTLYGLFTHSSGFESKASNSAPANSRSMAEPEKQAAAVKIIQKEIEDAAQVFASGQMMAVEVTQLAESDLNDLYGNVEPPKDAYRTAVQNILNEEAALKAKYPNYVGTNDFYTYLGHYYDRGAGVATLKIPKMEAWIQKHF